MSRKLLNDVSIDELFGMRENGMSNQEIADSLGVHYSTVLSAIGPQPKELRRKPEYRTDRLPPPTFSERAAPNHQACLVVENRMIELAGVFGGYLIPTHDRIINITIGEGSVSVPFDKLNDFISELDAIARKLKDIEFGTEMW